MFFGELIPCCWVNLIRIRNSGISININAFSQFFKTIINALFHQRKSFRQLCDWF